MSLTHWDIPSFIHNMSTRGERGQREPSHTTFCRSWIVKDSWELSRKGMPERWNSMYKGPKDKKELYVLLSQQNKSLQHSWGIPVHPHGNRLLLEHSIYGISQWTWKPARSACRPLAKSSTCLEIQLRDACLVPPPPTPIGHVPLSQGPTSPQTSLLPLLTLQVL